MQQRSASTLDLNVRDILSRALGKKSFSIFDLHTHITSPDVREQKARPNYKDKIESRGLNAIVQTEHNFPPHTFNSSVFIPGIEIGTVHGHVNLLGIDREYREFIKTFYPLEDEEMVTMKKKVIGLDQVLHDLDQWYSSPREMPSIVFPHPFQKGGVFYNKEPSEVIQALKKKGVPNVEDRVYLLEWTNGYRGPSEENAQRVIETVKKAEYDFVLVAGSDSHKSQDVGMAGIIVFPGSSLSFQTVKQVVLRKKHLVYHISLDPKNPDYLTLTIIDPVGKERTDYIIHHDKSMVRFAQVVKN